MPASLQAAVTAQSIAWCASLSSVPGKKAEKLESALARKKQAGWKETRGAGFDAIGRRCAPTRVAYRWVKGISGWISSPKVKEVGLDELLPDAPEEEEDGVDDWSNSCEALRILTSSRDSGQVTPAADQVAAEHEAAEWAS